MVNFEIVSLVVFISIVGLLLLKDRKNLTFHYGIIIRRWDRGLHLIDRFVKRYPRFLTLVGNFAVVIGVIAGLVGVVTLIFLTVGLRQDTRLILPTAGGYQIPGPVLSVPFWYWLIAIFIIIVTHETMHAVYARLEKVPVKNYGIMMLLLLPIGAFVDPDMKKVKRLDLLKKLRIFVAGSFINFIVAIVAFGIFISSAFAFGMITKPAGISIDSVAEGSPADKAGLEGTIHKINDAPINDVADFVEALNGTEAGDIVSIATDKGNYEIVLGKHPEIENKSYVGVTVRSIYEYNAFGIDGAVPLIFMRIFLTVLSFLNWLFFLSSAIGVVNLLPIKPFDGGLFFGAILTRFFKHKGDMIINITSVVLLGLLLFNLFGVSWLKSVIG